MSEHAVVAPEEVAAEIVRAGFAFVSGEALSTTLGELSGFAEFANSWHDLVLDEYMADGGRYRRRRYARYQFVDGNWARAPHGPHYQSRSYNALNGGIERWFDPVAPAVGDSPWMWALLEFGRVQFACVVQNALDWELEVHQFRIEAGLSINGNPTPEGLHRDGVDYVLVVLVARHNIVRGTTTIYENGAERGSFTLTAPLDSALVDDSRMQHGVTAVMPLDIEQPAYRDVLVVTFRRRAVPTL